MGEETILDRIREWIGSAAFRVFLWSVRMTEKQYLTAIECSVLKARATGERQL